MLEAPQSTCIRAFWIQFPSVLSQSIIGPISQISQVLVFTNPAPFPDALRNADKLFMVVHPHGIPGHNFKQFLLPSSEQLGSFLKIADSSLGTVAQFYLSGPIVPLVCLCQGFAPEIIASAFPTYTETRFASRQRFSPIQKTGNGIITQVITFIHGICSPAIYPTPHSASTGSMAPISAGKYSFQSPTIP